MQLKQRLFYSLMAAFWITSIAFADILIVHGRLLPETDSRWREQLKPISRGYVRYEIIDIGRGELDSNISNTCKDENGQVISTNAIPISFLLRTGQDPLPPDAILILDNGFWEQFVPQHSYRVLGEEAWRGILPYSAEAWDAILEKSNDELAEVPPADRLSREDIYEVLAKPLMRLGVAEKDIYIWLLRRIPFQWIVNACFLKDGQLYDYTVTVNDRGDMLNDARPEPNRYYQAGEEVIAFFSRERPDFTPLRRHEQPE
jgi:hypothetical protein